MAKPRVFLSSTYYDLKSVRGGLEYVIKDMGYEPVLHERGGVTYVSNNSLEDNCYKEIEGCDILVSLIGGRFGANASRSEYSISQEELRTAHDQGKAVYIFIERSVFSEFNTYRANRDRDVKWTSVDNVKIFEFIDEVQRLPLNNPIHPFETSFHITEFLKTQWAGLFQQLLSKLSDYKHLSMFTEIKNVLDTARGLTDAVAKHAENNDSLASELIISTHPLLSDLRKKLNVNYRFIVQDIDELQRWLSNRNYRPVDQVVPDDSYYYYSRDLRGESEISILKIASELFDLEGNIIPLTQKNWRDEFVFIQTVPRATQKRSAFDDDLDDDVPF